METTDIVNRVTLRFMDLTQEVCEVDNCEITSLSEKNKIIFESLIEQMAEFIETVIEEDTKIICESYEQYEKLETEYYQGLHQDYSKVDLIDLLFEEIGPERKHELMEKFFGREIDNRF